MVLLQRVLLHFALTSGSVHCHIALHSHYSSPVSSSPLRYLLVCSSKSIASGLCTEDSQLRVITACQTAKALHEDDDEPLL